MIKGGVWKNTEDEILKVAVMKYGKNQWARISSLLTRKSPKQCKARWFEWLDPAIKKTEWSKEEDEKLLHLAKLMPTQWRTIAPIVGRTASQCLERYQKLLDEAELKEGEVDDAGPTGDDVRRLRPGEIDPEPEAKPARPDPVDMDEDEKEMLSEARARLANTQGKKAKRKAREKQLEEARRLAALQKRRELKAAGIEVRQKKQKRGMDYNADIPFHKQAPAGFWDVNEEKDREEKEHRAITNIRLEKLEGKRRIDIEEAERKKDAKRQKIRKEAGDYVPPQAKRAAEQLQFTERKKLSLPAPQVGESEIEEIVKIGAAGENAKAIVDSEEFAASRGLLGDYSSNFSAGTPLRTPRTPAVGDQLRLQARNLRAMEHAQTPLLGGDVGLEGDVTFDGSTPRATAIQTPNPLAAQLTPRAGGPSEAMTPRSSVSMTPRSTAGGSSTFGRTPLRDQMGINSSIATPRSDFSGFDETPRQERQRQNLIRQQLADHFKALPKPKNDFEIVIPDQTGDADEGASTIDTGIKGDEDAADIEARGLAARTAEEQARLNRRSQPVKRDLPRPNIIVPEAVLDEPCDAVDLMIRQEMLRMMQNDAAREPAPGQHVPAFHVQPLDAIDDAVLEAASRLLLAEFAKLKVDVADATEKYGPLHQRACVNAGVFVRGQDRQSAGAFHTGLAQSAIIDSRRADLDAHREQMRRDAARAQKLEKKLGVVLGGYAGRAQKLRREVVEKWREAEGKKLELETFRALQVLENTGGPARIERIGKEVKGLESRERDLQTRYGELAVEKTSLKAEIVALKAAAKAAAKEAKRNGTNGVQDDDEEEEEHGSGSAEDGD
ncbi:CDC5 cell division cycle 5-like protein [Geranomyces variabilis]|uniref:CDC5 cell division cycle 5-like protein n=1 Tax=Geranomyces variabilis TaxID=109894 RepID=A0AAD5TE24_9FUNG|nr:CDC5 cell division cycle 5-like protein [Geranomyces variabilis]